MRRTKIFIAFTVFFTVYFFAWQPVYAYRVPSTFNQFMTMTQSGASKIASASSIVGRGLFLGRLLMGFTVAGGLLSIALTVWDGINRLRDDVKANVNMPVGPTVNHIPSSDSQFSWGYYTNTYFWREQVSTCTGVREKSAYVPSTFVPSGSYYIVGQSVRTITLPRGMTCDNNGDGVVELLDYYSVEEFTYYGVKPNNISGSYSEQSLGTVVDTATASNTQIAYATLTQAIDKLDEFSNRVGSMSLPPEFQIQISPDSTRQLLQDAKNVMDSGVSVQKDIDYIVVDNEKASPVPEGQGPGEGGSSVPTPPVTDVPSVTDGTCQEYVRRRTFSQVWSEISTQADNVGLLQLLNKLVINPVGGSAPDTISFSVSPFGSVNFDLNTYHYRDIILAFRFFVLAGAFIAAYYIIFT
ncbi:hypothetical protein A45J_2426 [hot springs metagenome]|uniref:Uncharacterized protein n=1 Tax=hot springs metagenome TaxID=433727 RepID=A0A5J4L5W4_9ZZZZ